MRKLRVGFTVQINEKNESLWTNGIKQNAITLRDLFASCPNVESSKLINLGTLKDYKDTVWEKFAENIIDFDTCLDTIDVVITATVTPTDLMVEKLHAKGISMIKHIMGHEYQMFSEHMLFNFDKQLNSYKKRKYHKAVWISPHLFDSNKDFFEVICDAPASIGPYVWTPRFLEQHVEEYKKINGGTGLYEPRGKEAKLLSTFEPNINLIKTSLTPIIITEKFNNKAPQYLDKMNVFGGEKVKSKKILVEFVADLTCYKQKKIFFEARYPIVWSLLKHTDIVVCHQRDLALNYVYFDAAWLGFPVVHNAHLVKDLGFYYENWNAEQASDLLVQICQNFDSTREEYLQKSRKTISKFLPENEANIKGYAELLEMAVR